MALGSSIESKKLKQFDESSSSTLIRLTKIRNILRKNLHG